jgi:hypothetical protein
MANEISYTLGLSVANGPESTIPVAQGTVQFDQTGQGTGGWTATCSASASPTGQIDPTALSATPGMMLCQNISKNTADLNYFIHISGTWYQLGIIKPGMYAELPQFMNTGYLYGFSGVAAPAQVQVTVLTA